VGYVAMHVALTLVAAASSIVGGDIEGKILMWVFVVKTLAGAGLGVTTGTSKIRLARSGSALRGDS
jgi:hypothetical protein